jgi:hypothetical protein
VEEGRGWGGVEDLVGWIEWLNRIPRARGWSRKIELICLSMLKSSRLYWFYKPRPPRAHLGPALFTIQCIYRGVHPRK